MSNIRVNTFASGSKLLKRLKVNLSGPGEVFSASFSFLRTSALEKLEEIGGEAAAFTVPKTDRSTGGVVEGKNFCFNLAWLILHEFWLCPRIFLTALLRFFLYKR